MKLFLSRGSSRVYYSRKGKPYKFTKAPNEAKASCNIDNADDILFILRHPDVMFPDDCVITIQQENGVAKIIEISTKEKRAKERKKLAKVEILQHRTKRAKKE